MVQFREEKQVEQLVVINLASTQAAPNLTENLFQTPAAFEAAVQANDERIPPATLYAYAAILEDVPYVNFTPSCAADAPALLRLAEARGVPVAGKDGKTGQKMTSWPNSNRCSRRHWPMSNRRCCLRRRA